MAHSVGMRAIIQICQRTSHTTSLLIAGPLVQQSRRCAGSGVLILRCNTRRPLDGCGRRYLATETTSSDPKSEAASSAKTDEQPGVSKGVDKRLFSVARASKKEKEKEKESIPLAKPSEKIGKVRAMREFCLTDEQLKEVRCQMRRSPFLGEPPDVVFLVSDVNERALEVHGGKAGLEKARRMRSLLYSDRLRARLSDEVPQKFRSGQRALENQKGVGMKSKAGQVVHVAMAMNMADCVVKFCGWLMTGSHSLFAEAIHSGVDTLNQLILATGIHFAERKPNQNYPYGYGNLRYVTSLISGCGIFCFGCGLSVYHGIDGLLHPGHLEPLTYAYAALFTSLCFQAVSGRKAYVGISQKALAAKTTMYNYVMTGRDPSMNVVLLEDAAAITGVGIALVCVSLSSYLMSPIPDAVGSILIGGLLGCVAVFIIRSNTTHLVGQSLPRSVIDDITSQLVNDPMIGSVHDVKATVLGTDKQRFKAEIDFSGRNITAKYLKQCDLDNMLKEVKALESPEALNTFMVHHGEKIVDQLGAEVDRIEQEIKEKHPSIRHVDLEAL